MADWHEIRCISRGDGTDTHERVRAVGGTSPSGAPWRLEAEAAIAGIESGRWAFYVNQDNQRVPVVVAVSRHGHKYLKTGADGEEPDNLLSLPDCGG
ncbi:MAG TPA: DUF3892 domain-containing protein [Longimicrobium sp.]|nr:DUF3892 domain-containing protein [Longimicrobium sp.]